MLFSLFTFLLGVWTSLVAGRAVIMENRFLFFFFTAAYLSMALSPIRSQWVCEHSAKA